MSATELSISRAAAVVGAFVAAALWLYGDAVLTLHRVWTSDDNPTYSHGWLLALVVAGMMIHRWRSLSPAPALNPSTGGALLVLLVSGGWLVAELASIRLGVVLAVPAIVIALMAALLGFRQARWFVFPLALLLGALPLWDFAGLYLQRLTAVAVGTLVEASMIPTVREGMFIMVPAGTFEVARGCSGLAYALTAVVLGLMFSYMRGLRPRYALLVTAAAVPVALVANIIRVYTIIVMGQVTGMQTYFVTGEHVSLGWAVFAVAITLFLWAANRWAVRERWVRTGRLDNDGAGGAPAAHAPARLALILVFLAAGPVAYAQFYRAILEAPVPPLSLDLPARIGDYSRAGQGYDYRPEFARADVQGEGVYTRAGRTIYMYMAYYHVQRQGREAINDLNRLADGRRWVKAGSQVVAPALINGREVREARLRSRGGEHRLVWQWYEIGGRQVADRWEGKALNILAALRGRASAQVVLLATGMDEGAGAAREALAEFATALEATGRLVNEG